MSTDQKKKPSIWVPIILILLVLLQILALALITRYENKHKEEPIKIETTNKVED